MRAALALALIAAAGLGVELASDGPELRPVRAPAESVEAPDGALLGALEFDGSARLVWLRPGTLRPASPPLRLEEDFISDFALSPDGKRLAVGSEMQSRVELVDLRGWRSLGTIALTGARPAANGGASGLVWARRDGCSRCPGWHTGLPRSPWWWIPGDGASCTCRTGAGGRFSRARRAIGSYSSPRRRDARRPAGPGS